MNTNGSTHTPIKRIAILSVHTCPLAMLGGKKTGGMNVYVRDFSREMLRHGIQLDVFTRSQDDCVPHIVHDLGDGGRVIHVPAGPEKPLPVPEVANYLDEFTDGVVAFAKKEGIEYDIIHSHYWLSGLVAEKLRDRWQNDIPVVQMFHTLGRMKNKINPNPANRAPQSRIDGEQHVINHVADRLIAATPAEEEQLVALYDADPEKITIIPPGVDLQRFHPIDMATAKETIGLDACKKVILLAARIEPLKGIDTLLKAVAAVEKCCSETLKDVCVVIVGGDPWADNPDAEMARLQQMRKDLDIEHLVTFVGSKDQMVLPNYYGSAEMVIMPSHYESFGLVALESMAMGIPVIASEVGGLAHLVQDGVTGYHVPSRDADTLGVKIYSLLKDDALRGQMADCASVYAQQYSWTNVVCEMLNVYIELITGLASEKPPFNFGATAHLPCASELINT